MPSPTVTTRTASVIAAFTTSTTSAADTPADANAATARSRSKRPIPGNCAASGMRWSTTSASVTVGSRPPRP